MRRSVLLTLLATILWFWFCDFWYTCRIESVCYSCGNKTTLVEKKKEVIETLPATDARKPIDFKFSEVKPYKNDGFSDYYSSLLDGDEDDNRLEIVGWYWGNEENTSDYENMGIARANALKALLAKDVATERIKISSKLMDGDASEKEYFEAAEFVWIAKPKTLERVGDKMIVRFPYNSVEKDFDEKVDDYLDKLSVQLKETGDRVLLVGHTDNRGGHENNAILGMRRAKMIRDILVQKGVSPNKIFTKTKGETEPIDVNTTSEGRHNNRRTEIKVLKK